MKIVSIGAGNLSTHLTIALQNSGFEIAQVYSRTETSAKGLAEILHVPYTTDIGTVTRDASLYIVTVSDNAIESVSESLTKIKGLVVHSSGSIPMNVFSGKFKNFGVIYPLQTFSKFCPVDFTTIPVFIEANTWNSLQILRKIANTISHKVYNATSLDRMKLHLAAVFGCNFVNHLYSLSFQIAYDAGFDFSVLSTLILETAHKALSSGNPKEIQTGPAARKDYNVMQKHLDFLASKPELHEIYSLISENIIKQSSIC